MNKNTYYITALFFLFVCVGLAEPDVAKSEKATNVAAKKLISYVNNHDYIGYSSLFCDKETFFKKVYGVKDGEISDASMSYSYDRAIKQFSDDCFAFWDVGSGYHRPVLLRLISVKEHANKTPKDSKCLEICVEYGNGSGTGRAYIVTGPGIETEKGFRFTSRCQYIFSPYPIHHLPDK